MNIICSRYEKINLSSKWIHSNSLSFFKDLIRQHFNHEYIKVISLSKEFIKELEFLLEYFMVNSELKNIYFPIIHIQDNNTILAKLILAFKKSNYHKYIHPVECWVPIGIDSETNRPFGESVPVEILLKNKEFTVGRIITPISNEVRLVIRNEPNEFSKMGFPSSRRGPSWFILPECYTNSSDLLGFESPF